jgi:hypothetical protein
MLPCLTYPSLDPKKTHYDTKSWHAVLLLLECFMCVFAWIRTFLVYFCDVTHYYSKARTESVPSGKRES